MLKMLDRLYIAAYTGVKSFQKEERGAVDIMAVVILIAIAIALAIIFKERIKTIIENLFDNMDQSTKQFNS